MAIRENSNILRDNNLKTLEEKIEIVPQKDRTLIEELEDLEKTYKLFCLAESNKEGRKSSIRYIDLFINNRCNLKCKHCYVKYEEESEGLGVDEIKKVISDLKDCGAMVFGIVGKEPLLDWNKTKEILYFLKEKRKEEHRLRFGIVTNGTLLDESKAEELKKIDPTYIDLSVDGTKKEHEYIRGKGQYDKVINAIRNLKKKGLENKIFISYTLNKKNQNVFLPLVDDLQKEGIKQFLVSPYLTTVKNDPLEVSLKDYLNFVENIMEESKRKKFNAEIFIKNDYTSKKYQMELIDKGVINLNKLLVDDNYALWNIKEINGNKLLFNIQPWDTQNWYGVRVSHDGYVSDCFSMFYRNYPDRAIGNVKKNSIKEILKLYINS